ncbi:hypothetical protein WJX74_007301 [Apatococcus lobatus]|uniref:t-SNARE coiled-coil homology domain-containing protein n=1 Tax=Apatococcus lobatus TaxID=904363 RepID=A0AAW1QJ77_9CHLO
MSNQDPFYLVKDDIQGSLDKAQNKYSKWQSLSKGNAEKRKLEVDIEDECKSITWQVDEMSKAVDVAEKNMQRFGLNPTEILSRRKWVANTRKQTETIMSSVDSSRTGGSKVSGPATATSKLGSAVRQENDRYINSEGDRQTLLVRQQDDQLTEMGDQISRIGHIGLQIHDELQGQEVLLNELDSDVESTQSRLAAAQKKMSHVLQKAGLRGQICIMVFLIVVLIILLALVIQ